MPLYIRIALRYLFSIRSKALSFMTVISIIGITVGVAALLITISVMSGFQYGLKSKIVETNPHVLVFKIGSSVGSDEYSTIEKEIKTVKGIIDTQPIIYSQAVAKKEETITPVFIKGILPDKEINISKIDRRLIAGDFLLLKQSGFAVIGSDLAFILDAWIGDKITVLSPYGKRTPFGYVPKMKVFKVAGVVDFGVYELNSSFFAVNIIDAQFLFNMEDSYTGIQLLLKEPFEADKIKEKLAKILPEEFIIKTWIDINKSLFQALQLEKLGMFLVLTLIVLVASFNISSLLITKSREKRKDIAILKTVGADNNFIMKVFLWQGLIIGITGIFIGMIFGLSVIFTVDTFKLVKLNPDVYMINYLPLKISGLDILSVVTAAFLISFISSVIPAKIASKETPTEILRYE